MAKLTLNDISSGFTSNTAHNTNNTLIENALENTLSRDGTSPNQMLANLDMNTHRIVNLQEPINANEAARLADVQNAISGATAANLISNSPFGNISATNVQAAINELETEKSSLAQLASNIGATLIGYYNAATGAVLRTLSDKVGDFVSVKDFGAVGNSVHDDTVAIQKAVDYAGILGKAVFFPAGIYMISASILMPAVYRQYETNRYTTPKLIGEGGASSLVYHTGIEAAFIYPAQGLDFVIIEDLGIYIPPFTGAGGGIKLLVGPINLYLTRFFMLNCGPGQWGVNQAPDSGTITTCEISGRFWSPYSYQGGAINITDCINLRVHDTFISGNGKNGPILQINNAKNVTIDTIQIEGVLDTTTVQSGITFAGTCFNINIKNLWLEGHLKKGIDLGTGNIIFGDITGVKALFYDGNPSAQIIDASNLAADSGITIRDINYYCASALSGTGYIINDPNGYTQFDATTRYNGSSGNQLSRAWKQTYEHDSGVVTLTLTGCTTSPTILFDYVKTKNIVVLTPQADSITGTSNTTGKTLTGLPSNLYPKDKYYDHAMSSDNGGAVSMSACRISNTTGVITLQPTVASATWTASGTMIWYPKTYVYVSN